MIFNALYEATLRQELILIDGGLCHWHLCTQGAKAGQITIREIISTRLGAGRAMLAHLRAVPGARCLLAKCPADLESNGWYAHMGFTQIAIEHSKAGRAINVWRLDLL